MCVLLLNVVVAMPLLNETSPASNLKHTHSCSLVLLLCVCLGGGGGGGGDEASTTVVNIAVGCGKACLVPPLSVAVVWTG